MYNDCDWTEHAMVEWQSEIQTCGLTQNVSEWVKSCGSYKFRFLETQNMSKVSIGIWKCNYY
jgi:hypothetical protein